MRSCESSQQWLTESALLFQAYPTTSRVTTKYTIHPPPSAATRKRKRQPHRPSERISSPVSTTAAPPEQPAPAPQPTASDQKPPPGPKASLTLKTFDPVSGVCLKYRTDKAAEVGRLIASLGRLGKHMAALPEADDADKVLDASAEGAAQDGVEKVGGGGETGGGAPHAVDGKAGAGGGGGGGKKKKKGKK